MRILCLEDHPDICEAVIYALQGEGYEVTAAGSVAEAGRLRRLERFAVYIVDDYLPDGTGLDFIADVRGSGDQTPILVHSASPLPRDVVAALRAGANEYIVKPNCWARLIEKVHLLAHSRPDRPDQAA
jgi:DNA-binding response OmpR family regulator